MTMRLMLALTAALCMAAFPATAEQKEAAPAPEPPSLMKKGESNPNPHFRRCSMKDMSGTWEMVGVAGKALDVFPGDPICHKHQWLIFEEGVKFRHVFFKEEKTLPQVKMLAASAPNDRSYAVDNRGVLTFTQPDGKVHQICMISTANDGNSVAGDMLLSSYQGGQLALIRLFRKSSHTLF